MIVQPGLVYGPGDTSLVHDTLGQYLPRKLPLVPARTAYCWAHVADTARGHLLAMARGQPGESYIIAGPPHTLVEALALAERLTGIPAPRLHAPPSLLKALSTVVAPFDRLLPLPGAYTSEGLRDIAGVTYLGSNARARREFEYAPRSLEEGFPETLKWEMARVGITSKQ